MRRARHPATAAVPTSKRRRLQQQQPAVTMTPARTGRSHTDIYTRALGSRREVIHKHTHTSTHPTAFQLDSLRFTLFLCFFSLCHCATNQQNDGAQRRSMRITYPVAAESGARALCLHTSEEGQVAEFGENQQEHTLHALRRHLKRGAEVKGSRWGSRKAFYWKK